MSQMRARFQPLAKSEQIELISLAKSGDRLARERLVDSVMPLVIRIATRLSRGKRRTYLLDLIQEGAVGVIRAIDRFAIEAGSGWTSYAANGARLAMLSYIETTRYDSRTCYLKANIDGIVDVPDDRPDRSEPDAVPHAIAICNDAREQMRRRNPKGYEVVRHRLSGASARATSMSVGVSEKRAYIIMRKAVSPAISSRVAAVVVCRETAFHAMKILTSHEEIDRVENYQG